MLKWLRPSTVEFPIIWKTFKSINGQKQYWIQDVINTHRPQLLKFTLDGFLRDEPLTKLAGLSNETKVREFSKFWNRVLDQCVSMVCLTSNSYGEPVITGVNYTMVLSKEDNFFSSNDPDFNKFLKILEFIERESNLFEKLDITEYLSSFGLYVHPEYRKNGIAQNLLAARVSMCKTFNLPATGAIFGAEVSQKAAKNAGFQDLYTISSREFLQKMQLTSSKNDVNISVIKFMYKSFK